jgi:hypothetical protein
MGNFWDAFVFRIWAGLGEHNHSGFATAAELLVLAHRLRLLMPAELNDLSILLILLTCPGDSALHHEANNEYQARSLTREEEAAALREALPPHLTELYLLGYWGEPRQNALVRRTVFALYLPALTRFMARLALTDYAVAEDFAGWDLHFAHKTLDYEDIHSDQLVTGVYAKTWGSDWPCADSWPAKPPAWAKTLSEAERAFLSCCLNLGRGTRYVLYLSFYGRLNARQIAGILASDSGDLLEHQPKAEDVVDWLYDSWSEVLHGLKTLASRI